MLEWTIGSGITETAVQMIQGYAFMHDVDIFSSAMADIEHDRWLQ